MDPRDRNAARLDRRNLEFVQLMGAHECRLRAFILSLMPNWTDAEEIAQEVRLRLWEQFDAFQPEKNFGVWACTIAYYEILTHRKRHTRHRQILLSAEMIEVLASEFPRAYELAPAREHALADCLKKLPASKRRLLEQYYVQHQALTDLATEFGKSLHATRHILLRTRVALAECIEKSLREDEA